MRLPALVAAVTALRSVLELDDPPRLTLMIGAREEAVTVAPPGPAAGRPAAYRMPCAMSKYEPFPVTSSTRTGRMRTFQLIPVVPTPSLPTAPIVPATCVP